jgi:hypothetical protein
LSRIRTVKPEWLEDELLAAASDAARTLSIGLIILADDYGNGRASIATIAASVWRFDLERDDGAKATETLAKASGAFRELIAIRFIGCWTESGQRYYTIRNWARHQRVDKPGKPLVPSPPRDLFDEEKVGEKGDSRTSPEVVASPSRKPPESPAPDQDQDQDQDQEGNGSIGAAGSAGPEITELLQLMPPASAGATKRPKRRWTRVPADWQPTAEHRGLAFQLGVPFDEELAKFRDHEFRNPKTDPDACFRTWLKNSLEFRRTAAGARVVSNGRAGDGLERQANRAAALRALESGIKVLPP